MATATRWLEKKFKIVMRRYVSFVEFLCNHAGKKEALFGAPGQRS
jgi:hypothetical protein